MNVLIKINDVSYEICKYLSHRDILFLYCAYKKSIPNVINKLIINTKFIDVFRCIDCKQIEEHYKKVKCHNCNNSACYHCSRSFEHNSYCKKCYKTMPIQCSCCSNYCGFYDVIRCDGCDDLICCSCLYGPSRYCRNCVNNCPGCDITIYGFSNPCNICDKAPCMGCLYFCKDCNNFPFCLNCKEEHNLICEHKN